MNNYLLILWCVLSGLTRTPEYLFPLSIEPGISGTFGEYRVYRFHGGVDLRTHGVMGYPVKAAEAGEVFQVKHFAGGDGKVLYVRHGNGQITVYAHLFEFMPEIEKRVQKERKRLNKYGFRIWLEKPLRVKRGEIIGYTGKSGTSSPHLHFEIRTPDNQPLNPFKNGLPIRDKTPPLLKALILEPIGPFSAVEGGPTSHRFSFLQREGTYILSKTPRVAGRVRITLEACDETTPGSCNGVYRIEAGRSANHPEFKISFDNFSFLDNFKGLSLYEAGSNFFQGRYRYRLFPEPSACNPFLLSKPDPSWMNGFEAPEHLIIRVYDAADNYAIAKIFIEKDSGSYDFSEEILKYPLFVNAGQKKSLSFDKGSFKLEFNPESLCKDDYLAIKKTVEGENTVYSTRFQQNASAKPVKITMKIPKEMHLNKAGIFTRASKEHGWRYLYTNVDKKSHHASAYSVLPGDFALREDHSKPVIGPDIYYGKARNLITLKRYEVSTPLYDYGAGLDPKSISLQIADVPKLWELNYPEKRIYCYLLEPLPPGRHRIYIKAADHVGNVSEFRKTLITPKP